MDIMEQTSENIASTERELQHKCDFLADYAAHMAGVGATVRRIEKNINRMGKPLGVSTVLTVLPGHIELVTESTKFDCQHAVAMRDVPRTGINFAQSSELSALSWRLADGDMSFRQARKAYHKIIMESRLDGWLLLVLVTAANMCFCRIFEGDIAAAIIVGVATAVGFTIKHYLSRKRVDARIVVISSAFVSSLIGCLAYNMPLCTTPMVALGTSVLYLIPGVIYLNSVADVIDGHTLRAFSEFANGVILTICIAVGLTIGVLAMSLNVYF